MAQVDTLTACVGTNESASGGHFVASRDLHPASTNLQRIYI